MDILNEKNRYCCNPCCPPGPQGPQGPQGIPGRPAVLQVPPALQDRQGLQAQADLILPSCSIQTTCPHTEEDR